MVNKNIKNKKVFVGLSGGVDSSVSALLLKQAGYEVTGVFIKGWQPDWIPCTWMNDRVSAMRTAAHLDIPFLTLDLEREYKSKVVNYILDEYKNGRTPNPDMLCNREIKFGAFLKWAKDMGADFVATGHYAQNIDGKMYESADEEKDQTYFLSQLSAENLKHILFPIGHLWKKEVRELATKHNLPVATRKDSQGICFVGDLEMKDFLKKELSPKTGDVLDTSGNKIGEHEGAILYTLGERHGFKINNKDILNSRHYIVAKDIDKNTLTVALDFEKDENFSDTLKLDNFSCAVEFSHFERLIKGKKKLELQTRYHGEKYIVDNLKIESPNTISIQLKKKVLISEGQFGVFYMDGLCLGGGPITTH